MSQTIHIIPSPYQRSLQFAEKGDVFFVELSGLRWPVELRQNPPRVRVLETPRHGEPSVLCELLDPWPDAPAYYPPEWAPGAPPAPIGSLYDQCPVPVFNRHPQH